MSTDDHRDGARPAGGLRAGEILARTGTRLRADPWLFAPFAAVSILLAGIDRLRRVDPIPARESPPVAADGVAIHAEYVGYPAGMSGTERALESLIGLEALYLLWGVGLEIVALLAVSLAGGVTIAGARGRAADPRSLVRLFGFVAGLTLLFRLIGSMGSVRGLGAVVLVPLLVVLYLFVRMFAAPGLVVEGHSIRSALGRSAHRTAGRGWTVFGLVLAIGLGVGLLGLVPIAGPVLATALVAPVHAVAIAVFLDGR